MKISQLKLKQLIKHIIRESIQDVNPEFADGTVRPMPATGVAEGRYDAKPCDCGSGQNSFWANDARGIPMKRVCPKCRDEKLKGYRQDVLSDPNYEADEPIEPDYQESVKENEDEGADLRGKFVDRGQIKLEGGLDPKLANYIANNHWDVMGELGKDERGVFNYKTRGDRWCCAVGMLDGKPAMLSVTTTPGRLHLLVGRELSNAHHENPAPDLNEMSTTGGAAGYMTPNAFTKNKKGSPKGIEAAKKYGTIVGETPRV